MLTMSLLDTMCDMVNTCIITILLPIFIQRLGQAQTNLLYTT